MLIFQPFGLSQIEGTDKTLVIAGYGLVTLLLLLMDHLCFWLYSRIRSNPRKWTVGKEIIFLALILFTIGLGNYFYSVSVFPMSKNVHTLLIFQFFTLAVGIIPVTIVTLMQQVRLAKINLTMATSFNRFLKKEDVVQSQEIVTITAEKELLTMNLPDFLYAEASGNYLKIYHLQNDKIKTNLLRCTLKSAENQLESFPTIVKCHRAFLVNTIQIVQANGNAQGLRIQLRNTGEEIPVSRSYTKMLMDKIQEK